MAGVTRTNKYYSGSKYYEKTSFKKRDFRIETYKTLNDLIVELNKTGDMGNSFWDGLGDWWQRVTKWAHKFKPTDTKNAVKKYYKRILDMNDTEQEEIYFRFRQIWQKDIDDATKTEVCISAIECAREYISVVKNNMSLDSSGRITDLSDSVMKTLSSYASRNEALFNKQKEALSDDELIAVIDEQLTDSSLELELRKFYDSNVLNNANTWDAFLVSLCEREDVWIDSVLGSTLGKESFYKLNKYLINQILKGNYDKYVAELMKKYNLSKEELLVVIGALEDNNKYKIADYESGKIVANVNDNLYDIQNNNINKDNIISDLKKMLAADGLLVGELAKATGYSEKEINLILNDTSSGYDKKCAKEQYKKLLSNLYSDDTSVSKTPSSEELQDARDELKKLQKYIKAGDKIINGKDANTIKEIKEELGLSSLQDNEVIKIIDKYGIETISYLCEDYTSSLETINSMISSTEEGSASYMALVSLRTEYQKGFDGITSVLLNDTLEIAADKAAETILSGITAGTYKTVSAVVDLGTEITGASDVASSVMDSRILTVMANDAYDCYNNAVAAVRNGDHSETALNNVRRSFDVAKETTSMLLDAEIEYYEAKGDTDSYYYKSYLQDKKEQLEDFELGDSASYISFDDFITQSTQ